MIKFVLFLKKIYVLLLFIILEGAALNFYANSTSYTKARLLTASNTVVGGIYKQFASIRGYFGLKTENDLLIEEIRQLQEELDNYRSLGADELSVELIHSEDVDLSQYVYTSANVINNSVNRQENFITLDKGRADGIEPNMAIVTPDAKIVGYILNCSEKFSVGISILNINFKTGGKIKGRDYFGFVEWNGKDSETVTLTEIPKYADMSVGDTVMTDHSSIFPRDVMIGTVMDFSLNHSNYYDVKVELAARMGSLRKVFLVRYADIVERTLLESETTGDAQVR